MRMSMYSCALVLVLLFPAISQAESSLVEPKGKSVKLEFTDARLSRVLEWFSQKAGMNFILPHRYSDQRITIISAQPVTTREAYQALQAALDVEHIHIRPVGKFALITRKPDKRGRKPAR